MGGSVEGGLMVAGEKSSTSPDVAAIVTNWKRPENTQRLLEVLDSQTVKPHVVLVNNSMTSPYELYGPFSERWDFPDRGIISRFAPALLDLSHKYTLLLDDDLLPGPRCVESLLKLAGELNDRFSTIGQVGRIYRRVGTTYEYQRRNVARDSEKPVRVDMTARGHFFVTASLLECARWWRRASSITSPAHVRGNDDVCLCQSIQLETKLPSYLIPGWDLDCLMRARDLPDGGVGASAGDTFYKLRDELIRTFADLGWASQV